MEDDPEIAAIRERLERYRRIYDVPDGQPDWDEVIALYKTDDFMAYDIAPPVAGYLDWDAYAQGWGKILGKYRSIHFGINDDLRIRRLGDVAWMSFSGEWSGTSTGGDSFDKSFRQTMVWVKYAGEWRVVQEHGSMPMLTTLAGGEKV